jgi:dTDP-3-amino-3,4,6-trideoxy-alpha-D-glucose transaminase
MIPMVNLRPMLAATEPAWRANLERLFERMHFILGEQVKAFEAELAAALGARFAVTTGTGTAAIEIGLRAARVSDRRTEAIVPALTSPFTAQAVMAAGFRLRFADVDPETLLLDASEAESRLTRHTAAIVPVHLYGQSCEMVAFAKLARARGITVVQDACQAHGTVAAGRPPTRYSPAVALSFYPTKNLPCLGDGGAVLTDSRTLANRLRMLRDGGRRKDQLARIPAINSRLDEMQACYLRAFLPKLAEWNNHRRRIAAVYDEALSNCDAVRPVKRSAESVCHLYVIRARRRDALRRHLAEHGIATGVHYPVPLHRHPGFRDAISGRGAFPAAERACREIISLPLFPYFEESAAREVASRVCEFYR